MSSALLLQQAVSAISVMIAEIFHHSPGARSLLVYDEDAPFTQLLANAYRQALPEAKAVRFSPGEGPAILKEIDQLSPGDLVILIQSSSFRLDAFRIRVYLFQKGLKVIEHPHLARVRSEEFFTYVAALDYDGDYYRRVGPAVKERLDRAREVCLIGRGHRLIYGGALEPAKLNIGNYRDMKNIGGQFPIGEVFTELHDLTQLNGQVALFAFGAKNFSVFDCPQPIILHIAQGRVVKAEQSTPEFDEVLDDIKSHEGEIWVRELGFGLNRALTREHRIRDDVGIYERMCGVHLSLGGKHAIYPKSGFSKKRVKYHVDVFADIEQVRVDDGIIFEKGKYLF